MDKKFEIRRIVSRTPICDLSKMKPLEDGEGFKMDYLDTVACQMAKWVNEKEMNFVCSQIQKYIEENGINVCFVMNEDELKDCLQQHQLLKLRIAELEAELDKLIPERAQMKKEMKNGKRHSKRYYDVIKGKW